MMKYILQVFTGSWHETQVTPEQIIRKIHEIAARVPVDQVIIGWNTDLSLYRKVGVFLQKAGIRMLLWLPVFAETGDISEPEKALDIFGKPVPRPSSPEGGFLFHCPSSVRNIQIVKELYEKHFSGCGFDGVFFDRIRSQSFVSGVSGVLSCGCERCRKAFLNKGVDLHAVRRRYEEKEDAFFDMVSYPVNGRFVLKDELAQHFFDAKEMIIADAVAELSGYFRDKGMKVGLDLFAPLISRFVGQNYMLLAEHVDFIKPMMYRRTEAPAGIGFEYALYEKHAHHICCRMPFSMDRAFLYNQLEAIRELPCEKYPGIEINYDAELVRTDAGYIRESLAAIRNQGFACTVLCWNIMQARKELLSAVFTEGHGL